MLVIEAQGPALKGPERLELTLATIAIHIVTTARSVDTGSLQSDSWNMQTGSSRRDFIRRTLFGAGIGGLLSSVRAASDLAKTDSRLVDRRRLGRTGADVSILGLDFPSYRNRFYQISNSYSYIILRLFGQQTVLS